MFGVIHVYTSTLWKTFILVADHRPLLTLFNKKTKVSEKMASARIQKGALKLSGYHYTFRHNHAPGIMDGNPDGLSRLSLRGQPDVLEESPPPKVVSLLHRLEVSENLYQQTI